MYNRIKSVETYQFVSSDRLFLDTNVWMRVFGLNSLPDKDTDVYSRAFKRILEVGCEVYIDPVVMSEFVTVSSRIAWREHIKRMRKSGQHVRFKDFRRSQEFRPMAKNIDHYIQQISRYSRRIQIDFGKVDLAQMGKEIRLGRADFSDLIFSKICRENSLKLITDDGDFETNGITVITANKKLLTSRKGSSVR